MRIAAKVPRPLGGTLLRSFPQLRMPFHGLIIAIDQPSYPRRPSLT